MNQQSLEPLPIHGMCVKHICMIIFTDTGPTASQTFLPSVQPAKDHKPSSGVHQTLSFYY